MLSTPPWLAYLKISEGCDYTCSFCIIPTLRGRHRSRHVEDILAEARALAGRGVRELVLVAQDSTRYGLDHGIRDGLAYLLRRLAGIDGIRWIRVMYAYPQTLTDPDPRGDGRPRRRSSSYVDIPLQHASEAVLKRMKRPTGRGHLLGMIERIRERVPGVAIRTSFIVGFPGETDEEFEELLDFVRGGLLRQRRRLHLLRRGGHHRPRPGGFGPGGGQGGAPGAADGAPEASCRPGGTRPGWGRRLEVLVEGTHPDTDLLLCGRAAGQAPEIDGQVIINDGTAEPGEFVTVEITEAHPYDLVGRRI